MVFGKQLSPVGGVVTRIWKSSRGQGAVKVLDKTTEPVSRGRDPLEERRPETPRRYGEREEEINAISVELQIQGFSRAWNLRNGIGEFVSFWKHPSGAILLVHWFRDTGAVEIYKPIEAESLDDLYSEFERYITDKEDSQPV